MQEYTSGQVIYYNPLQCPRDVEGFIPEGDLRVSFDSGCMRLESIRSPEEGQAANFLFWCPQVFPDHIKIEWKFRPLNEPGLAMMFFCAQARQGGSIFSPDLAPRRGEYPQYNHGDINAYHLAYFRRRMEDERLFHTCNLRKSYGAHLVGQGGDPIPEAAEAKIFYDLRIEKDGPDIRFFINHLQILSYHDDGEFGPVLQQGNIGFRQMAPLAAEYSQLRITRL